MSAFRALAVPTAAVAIVAAVYLLRGLEFVEHDLIDTRFRLAAQPASGTVVIVGIDPNSVAQIGAWPWPRNHHARLIERLFAAGAEQVVLDIDLSTPTRASDDAALAATLARFGDRVVLPVFAQRQPIPGLRADIVYTEPLPAFLERASAAAVALRPDADGLVRRMPTIEGWRDTVVPTLAGALSRGLDRAPRLFYLDYGIDPATIPHLSYVDVLDGIVPAHALDGRRVIVGATTSQLGTHVPVPLWRSLPATTVHALAAESLILERALQRPSILISLLVAALAVLVLWQLARRLRPAAFAGAAVLTVGLSVAGATVTYLVSPILLDITPWVLAAVLVLAAGLVGNIEEQRGLVRSQAHALRRSSRFLSLILANIEEAAITTDRSGRIRNANEAATAMFATEESGMQGRDIADLFPGVMQASRRGADFLADLIAARTTQERLARRSDGSGFPVEIAVRAVDDGSDDAFVVIVRDISRRKAAEAERGQIERRLTDAMEGFGEAFALFDSNARLIGCNSAYRKLHRPVDSALMRTGSAYRDIAQAELDSGLIDVPDHEHIAWLTGPVERFGKSPLQASRGVPTAAGRWLQKIEHPTSEGGFISVLFDVTEATQREQALIEARDEAERANRAKSEFLSNMSHELRTPLNAVIGFSEMMRKEMLGPMPHPTYLEYSGAIHDSAHRLLSIIDEILDFANVETGRLEPAPVFVDLAATIAHAVDPFARRAAERGIRFDVAVADDLPRLWADRQMVARIVANLASNAVKFSQPGDSVAIRADMTAAGSIELRVTDTGIGIDRDHLARIVEPFGQVETAFTRTHDGAGLGLPVARSFARAHDAEFAIESAPGEGTTVTVRFPPARTQEMRAAGE